MTFPLCPGQEGPIADRFMRYVSGDWSADVCWEWSGARTPQGYGVFALTHRKQVRAHRFALKLYNGREPSQYVLHRCDNPACVNPLHLREGSHGENMKDMADRRRAAREERHHKSKLIWQEAAAITLLHRSGEYTTAELAALFGISKPTAIGVASGTLWPDVHAIANTMLAARKETDR